MAKSRQTSKKAAMTTSSGAVQVNKPAPRPRPIKKSTVAGTSSFNENTSPANNSSGTIVLPPLRAANNSPTGITLNSSTSDAAADPPQALQATTTTVNQISGSSSDKVDIVSVAIQPHQGPATDISTTVSGPKPAFKSKPANHLASVSVETSTPTTPTPGEEAVLAAKLAAALVEVDRLKNRESAMMAKTVKEIKRPQGTITDLQTALGLADNWPLYLSCRATVKAVMAEIAIPVDLDWRNQDPSILSKVANAVRKWHDHMRRYEQDWATHEIAWTVAKNKRGYQRKTGRSALHHSQEDSDDVEEQDADEQAETENNNEAEGTRKRTKAKQGSMREKRTKV